MTALVLIALDWGTTNLRAYLVGSGGEVIAREERPLGIMQVAKADFAGALGETLKAWLPLKPGLPIVACGMIGSRQGWREAPYVACPAAAADVARGMVPMEWRDGHQVLLIPGISCRDGQGVPDVIRGEETQIFGAVTGDGGLFLLPGTHSKWVAVEKGRIISFATFMTGEVFGVLRQHSILGRTMQGEGIDEGGFRRGVAAAAKGGGALLHGLFGARTMNLFGELAEQEGAGYLSGLLIGTELLEAPRVVGIAGKPSSIGLIGQPQLCRSYAMAAAELGYATSEAAPDAALHGIWRLACARGLVKEAA
ncbi:MAG TPA: 2-dehydro-3-deoxygalactonokinase [Verrucomicrobiae bacterium]|nr:2-dehydro-3-deoxygalactonokinase [Verrucomicrobiae bacterium]